MSQWMWDGRSSCLVEVITDEGIVGWGECYGPALTNAEIIKELYSPLLVNRDPLARNALWSELYNRSRDYGRKGFAITALSGIDIALWDIAGKEMKQPIYRLLGGTSELSIQCYASAFYYGGEHEGNIEKEALALRDLGYRAVKMKVGALPIESDVERVRRARQTLGSDVHLAVDANHAYTASEALRFGRQIEDQNIMWFEEPVEPEDLEGYRRTRNGLNIPISGGESEYTKFGFRDFLAAQCVDIIQPDVTACGGITEAMQISAMSSAYGTRYYPHVWGSAIAIAASLHIVSALQPTVHSQRNEQPWFELDQAPNVFRDKLSDLKVGPFTQVPNNPGLGIEIDKTLIEHYEI